MRWHIRDRQVQLGRPLVMGILNVTSDSFSDGGRFLDPQDAVDQAEKMIVEGADLIDIGGESTRPGSTRVSADEEIQRVVPVIERIVQRYDIPISIDTTKSSVADAAIEAGAHIINDISGLRFDQDVADVAAATGSGLILMHSRGDFETMHSQPAVDDVLSEVTCALHWAVETACLRGVASEQIVLDVGIGFGKTQAQNFELIAKLDKLKTKFPAFPILIGGSRKSFMGKLLDGASVDERLVGSLAIAAIAAWNDVDILRVHDVMETVETLKVVRAIRDQL